MAFLRSKPISHFQIVLPRQNSHRVISQIGRLAIAQFKLEQVNPNLMPFLAQVKLCEELLQKLIKIEEQLCSEGLGSFPQHYTQEEYDVFLKTTDLKYRLSDHSHLHLLQNVRQNIQAVWSKNQQLKQRKEYLQTQIQILTEELCLLKLGTKILGRSLFEMINEEVQIQTTKFTLGVLRKKDEFMLKRTIFRMSKGLSLLITFQEESEMLNKKQSQQKKIAFYLFYGYGQSTALQSKVSKLFSTYNIKPYSFPRKEEQVILKRQMLDKSMLQNQKLQELVQNQRKGIYSPLLIPIPTDSHFKITTLQYYKLYLLHQKLVYHQINQMKNQHSFLQAEIFVPSDHIQSLTIKLQQSLSQDRMPIPQLIPILDTAKPTLFQTNQITITQYQVLCAYGIPHYQQIIPTIFNIITFPFLYGVMFGDIVSGLIFLAFGIILVFFPHLISQTILKTLIIHKWSIVLMGFFSLYCGIIYNQYFSLNLDLFGSCYIITDNTAILQENCVYPLGVDPIWSISTNGLQFTNSLKMKISVIIAFVHMTLGLFLKTLNQKFDKKTIYIFLQTIPQFVFFTLFFGYMDFLIFYKWTHSWNPATAPSIITTMINIPLQLGKTQDCCGGQPMWGNNANDTSQNGIQLLFLIITLICVPLILFLKPLYIWLQKRKKEKKELFVSDFQQELRSSRVQQKIVVQNEALLSKNNNGEGIIMSQIFVYQLIQTIQFVLGCISNTASYLRLWALSLAHSSLSEVFFTETVQRGLRIGYVGIPVNLIIFPIYAAISFGILICMDSLECFLHTLRLHWVQFQNKFYKGDGQKFEVLSLQNFTNEWLQGNSKY